MATTHDAPPPRSDTLDTPTTTMHNNFSSIMINAPTATPHNNPFPIGTLVYFTTMKLMPAGNGHVSGWTKGQQPSVHIICNDRVKITHKPGSLHKKYESHGATAGNTNAGHGRLSIEVVPPTPPPHGHQGNPNSTNGNNNGTTNHNNTMTATSTPTPIPDVSRDTPWPSGAHIQNGRFYQPISQNTGTITSLCWSTVPWHIRNHRHL